MNVENHHAYVLKLQFCIGPSILTTIDLIYLGTKVTRGEIGFKSEFKK